MMSISATDGATIAADAVCVAPAPVSEEIPTSDPTESPKAADPLQEQREEVLRKAAEKYRSAQGIESQGPASARLPQDVLWENAGLGAVTWQICDKYSYGFFQKIPNMVLPACHGEIFPLLKTDRRLFLSCHKADLPQDTKWAPDAWFATK